MSADVAVVNGEVTARPMISVYDDGLLRGDGAYEVIRIYQGRPHALREHLDRLHGSATRLGITWDRAAVVEDMRKLLRGYDAVETCLRVVLTRGGARVLFLEDVSPARPLRPLC
jgi:branched-chain amino acid aminotransferase